MVLLLLLLQVSLQTATVVAAWQGRRVRVRAVRKKQGWKTLGVLWGHPA